MKKLLSLLLPTAALVTFACNGGNNFHHGDFTQLDESSGIFEVTYDRYNLDYMLKEGEGNAEWMNFATYAGCSSCYSNGFYGRNFDFIYNKIATIVVRTPNHDGCYKTLGVTGGLATYTLESLMRNNGITKDTESYLPLMMLDGINEKGVVCSINCVNAMDIGGLTKHTNEGKPKLNMECVVRYVIDHASNVDEAIELIKGRDIVYPRCLTGVKAKNFELHMMVADSQGKSCVIEFVEGGYHVTMGDNTKPETRVLTNFYLYQHLLGSTATDTYYPANSLGVERYEAICNQIGTDVTDINGMQDVMESVKYTNCNKTTKVGVLDPAYSDHPSFINGNLVNYRALEIESKKGGSTPLHDAIEDIMTQDDIEINAILNSKGEIPNVRKLWCTIHTSCYDIADSKLYVAEHENYGTSHANYQQFKL